MEMYNLAKLKNKNKTRESTSCSFNAEFKAFKGTMNFFPHFARASLAQTSRQSSVSLGDVLRSNYLTQNLICDN